MNRDLTVGNPGTVLWQFCLPLFGSVVFQQLYNIADSLVAGRFIGEEALAAVGNSYEVTLIFLAFAFGCNLGCSVIVSRYFGAGDLLGVRTTISTSWIASGILCGILMLVGIFGCGWLLELIRTPAEILADSKCYLDIYVWGLPFLFFYNISNGIFSALGDSKTPFFFLAASSVANILMDILFVTRFSMGVAGVAYATFLCQGVSCILSVLFVLRRVKAMGILEKAPLFSFKILGEITIIAVPGILQQSFISVGNILLQSLINGFGTSVVAGYAAAIKLNNLVITSFTTLSNGISNYTAQNMGANKPLRIRQGFFAGLRLVWVICLPVLVLYFGFGRFLLHLFMDAPTDQALQTGIVFLRIVAPFYFVVSAKLVADGILKGCSRMKEFMAGTFADLLLRVFLAFLLAQTGLGSVGIWCSWPVGWSVATAMALYFYTAMSKKFPPSDTPSQSHRPSRF